jgi:hypothetical protein
VTSVEVEILSNTSVMVSWNGVDIEVSGYIIYYRQTLNGVREVENSLTVPNSVTSKMVENLSGDTIYIFQVAALDGDIVGRNSSITDKSIVLLSACTYACGRGFMWIHMHTYYLFIASTVAAATELNLNRTRDIYITASVTFALTAILLAATLLIFCCICRACYSDVDTKDKRGSYS